MNEIQIILALLALTIFVIFFKQLFSGNYPKRGVDYGVKESYTTSEFNFPKKSKQDNKAKNRVKELFDIAKESLDKGDNIEAKKALQSLLILEPNNIDALRMLATAYMNMNDYTDAKETLLNLLELDKNDDLAHTLLANSYAKLSEFDNAIKHHEIAIRIDPSYAPYYYNYANTMYNFGDKTKALKLYKKALELDPSLEDAKNMIKELEDADR